MHSSLDEIKDLPQPDAQARQVSEQVLQKVGQACAAEGGLISFADYMRIALYEPELGYYSGGLHKFGEQGDFITAPEVSPLFSQCLANQVAEIADKLDDCQVIEFGAGSGVMAADILLRLEQLEHLPQHYYILELSAELQQRQRETIGSKAPHLLDRVTWLHSMPDNTLNAVVLANEILDAMPVECFRKNGDGIEQLVIGFENGGLLSDYRPAGEDLAQVVTNIEHRIEQELPDQYSSEVNLNIQPWLQFIYDSLQSGVVLLIDYGYTASEYYMSERQRGTLVCHYQHRAHNNPFWYPGLQDITAFVDFTDVAHAAVDVGYHVAAFTTQAAFLMSSGLADLHQEQLSDDVKQQISLSQQIKTLTLPSEMGEKFKVMALAKDYDEYMSGFMMQDHRGKL